MANKRKNKVMTHLKEVTSLEEKKQSNEMPKENVSVTGFTAAEIITVVAIIAILALIAIPKFWSRTEEARIASATEEMARMADAESLCYADTGFYVTLGNLHGTEPVTGGTAITTWNYQNWAAGGSGFTIMTVQTWQGPYITYQASQIQDETSFAPLDPWKNPYVFYGPISVSATNTTQSSKIRFWSAGQNLIFDSATTNPEVFPWGPAVGDDILYIR
jgi:Tfp pilus assembly protein PilE